MTFQSAAFTARCLYRTAAGRQCRQLSNDPRSGLCPQHLQKQNEHADLTRPLLHGWQGFQTAQGLNYSLSNLYKLLAANRISARRASVLAYINSLLLRTLPAIDADCEAGIDDPFAPKKPEEREDQEEQEAAASSNDETDPGETDDTGDHENSAATSPHATSPTTPKTNAQAKRDPHWPDAIPEPDPTKKPS
jgi:hypothetical protein